MKVAFVTPSVSRTAGGIFEIERCLAQNLDLLPHTKLEIFALRDQFTAADSISWEPLAPQTFPIVGLAGFGYSPGLRDAFNQCDSDIGHLHALWMFTSVVISQWSQRKQLPFIVTPNGMLEAWALKNSIWKKRFASLFYERRMLRQASVLQANTPKEAADFRNYGLKNPICIIPNGIDLPKNGNGKPESKNAPWGKLIDPGKKVLLFLSRIHPKKGLVNLVKAWSASQKSEWVLAIAGWDQGGHEAELKRLCDELELKWSDIRLSTQGSKLKTPQNCDVLFLGPQFGDAKTACYAACDAFVLPSFSEGLPMVVLEAWSHGKPTVITPECNLPEGFSTDSAIRIEANAKSIEEGLQRLFVMSDGERNDMGQRGLALVSERFTWPKIAREMRAVYEWVLGGGAKPASVIEI